MFSGNAVYHQHLLVLGLLSLEIVINAETSEILLEFNPRAKMNLTRVF